MPDEPLFRIAQGEAALAREDHAGARPHFTAALELYNRLVPGNSHWKPHFYLRALALESNQAAEAVKQLETARDRFPMQPAIHLLLGEAYEKSGDITSAKSSYDKVIELAPSGSDLHKEARTRRRRL